MAEETDDPKKAEAPAATAEAEKPNDEARTDDEKGGENPEIQRNEDGSITVAESDVPAKQGPAQRWTGPGIKPDSRYNSKLVAKFVNCLMQDGKKSTAERIMYKALETIADKLRVDPLNVFDQAIENAKPKVEVRSKRVGGSNYQVPVEVKSSRSQTLALRWILEAVRARKGKPTYEKLAQELIDCYNKTGTTIQKREGVHRMAEANKAFSHFA